MAQPYVPGPVDVWVGVGAGNAPVFLGHCEQGLDLDKRPRWGEIVCDLGGSVPMEEYYEGHDAVLSGTFIRYNDINYRALTDFSVARLAISVPGLEVPGDIGSLSITEQATYQLWCRFPYATKLVFNDPTAGAMVSGFRFLAARLERDGLPNLGPRPKKLRLSWRCLRVFNRAFIDPALGTGSFTLYDHDMAALPASHD